jgi:hypothetical protein
VPFDHLATEHALAAGADLSLGNPARSPSRSSRETSSQLAARPTTTPTQNSRIPGTQTSCGVGGGKR